MCIEYQVFQAEAEMFHLVNLQNLKGEFYRNDFRRT